MDTNSPEQFVSKYLIDNTYYLTALEFYSETYERTGVAIEELSQFFENSANFLMFEEMKSVSEISSNISESSCLNSDAIRIKDDRIAVLEHDIRILRDKLEETKDKLQHFQENSSPELGNMPSANNFLSSPNVSAQSSSQLSEMNSNPPTADEDTIINQLISQYLQKKNLKLSSLAFNNETGIGMQKKKVDLPEEYNLLYIIRNFRLFEQNPQMNDEIQKLRSDLDSQNAIIAQLRQELKLSQQSNSELLKKTAENDKHVESDENATNANDENNEQQFPIKNISSIQNACLTSQGSSNISFSNSQTPPTIELLDAIFSDMMQLMNVIDSSERRRIIKPLETIVRYHPVKETRIQCISLIFNIWEDPNEEQRGIIIQAITECCIDESHHINRIEDEVLPVVSQLLGSSNVKMLSLVALSVASFAPFCQSQLRCSLLLSIIVQLSEHSNPTVRESAVRGGSLLVDTLIGDSDAADKLTNLLDLCKTFVFDPDANVQQAALQNFVPSLLNFTQSRRCVGREFCEYWIKLFFSFGLTGTSQLAALRFSLCSKVLEASLKYIIPITPGPDQQLVAEGATTLNNSGDQTTIPDENNIPIPKTEYEWITMSLIPQLTKVAPTLFVQINIRKEADRFVATVCKSVGQQIVTEMIVPAFLTAIDKAEGDLKEKIVTLFISSVASMCDQETFFTQSRNFLTYATNDLRGFKSRDVQEYFAPAFTLITARDPEKRPLIFKLIDELSKSSRIAIKTAAVSILCEILPTLEETEIEKNVIPIIDKLAQSLDETLLLEVINCVGSVARFSLSVPVLNSIKELFDIWIKDKRASVRMQALRVFTVIINDVDEQFRDGFILSKLLDVAKDFASCTDPEQVDQAVMLILHCLHSVNNPSEKTIKELIKPTVEIIRQYEIIAQDPKLEEVIQKFELDKTKRGK